MTWHTPHFWRKRNAVSLLLFPLSGLYLLGYFLRRIFTRPVRVNAKVICIGNVVAGGAGKTPVAVAIGEWAKNKSFKACFLSKGYGGSLSGVWVDPARHDACEVGDEPLLLARTLPTFASRSRVAGAREAERQGYTHIILDDGYQNPTLHKDCSLLVIDAAYGLGNGLCLPAGPLREPANSAFSRAQAVLLTRRAGAASHTPAIPVSLPQFPTELVSTFSAEIAGRTLVAFTGIARPDSFFTSVVEAGGHLVHQAAFPDHHPFREEELNELASRAEEENAQLITTAKDAVRLPAEWCERIIIADLSAKWLDGSALFAMLT